MKRKFRFWFSLLTILAIPLIIVFVVSNAYFLAITYAGFYLLISHFLYLRYIKGVKTKYLLASKVQGICLPRSNIPRPIHKDYRDHPEFFEDKKKRERKRA